MIAIYPIRPGDDNPELQYSLRSLQNLPQITEVWSVGYKPTWMQPDRHINGNLQDTSHANVYDNIRRACRATTGQVAIFNDDIYATTHVTTIPTVYRSTLDEHLNLPRLQRAAGQWWPTSLQTTKTCLQAHGIETPLSYELHTPFVCDPQKMADTLDLFAYVTPDNPPQWRSLAGNMLNMGGAQSADGKAYGPGALNRPWHSTEDASFPYYAEQLADRFPDPSPYEKATVHA